MGNGELVQTREDVLFLEDIDEWHVCFALLVPYCGFGVGGEGGRVGDGAEEKLRISARKGVVEVGGGEAVQAGGGLAQSEEGGGVPVYVGEYLEEELFWELTEITLWGGHFEVMQSRLPVARQKYLPSGLQRRTWDTYTLQLQDPLRTTKRVGKLETLTCSYCNLEFDFSL